MKKLFIVLLTCFFANAYAQRNLCTPNPSPEAVNLYNYIKSLKGSKTLSGQQDCHTDGTTQHIYNVVGKYPAIRGLDFITQANNPGEVTNAKNWWNAGGIVTIMWHWGAPGIGEGYDNAKKSIDISRCFQSGTAEYTAFWSELKIKADLLQQLRDAHVPVLWRPYHECDGGWFWWGMGGSSNFKKLWTTMWDYFVNTRGLNNLVWTLCNSGSTNNYASWYPGDAYVDIAGGDTYVTVNSPQSGIYNAVKSVTGNQVPIVLHECGTIPDPAQCQSQGIIWSWWMLWSGSFCMNYNTTTLQTIYNNSLIITRDEVPNLKSGCIATSIIPYLQVAGGTLAQIASVTLNSGTQITLSPSPATGGSWSWSGLGTSGTTRIQTITPTTSGTATATYTNDCGAVSTQIYTITIAGACTPTAIVPYTQINAGTWAQTGTATVNAGANIIFGPQPATGGSWSWSGPNGFTAATREITLTGIQATQAGNYVATYTNAAGCISTNTFVVTVSGSVVAVTGVSVTPTSASIAVGGTSQITATVAPANATNKAVTWTSSNTAIATVGATGLVTGVAAGNTTITVKTQDGSFTATFAVTVTGGTPSCAFGAPLASGLPTISKAYNYVYLLGAGPSFANISNMTINWDLANKGLYQLSMSTKDGKPNWYVDLRAMATQTFASAQPAITFSGTGFPGLDGSYYVAIDNGNFVLAEKTGAYTIYFSASAIAPVCTKSAEGELVSQESVMLYPNPFSSNVTLKVNNASDVKSIKVINQLGMAIQILDVNLFRNNQLEFGNHLPAGIYFIQVKEKESTKTYKIIKK